MSEMLRPGTMVEHSPGGLAEILGGPQKRYGREEYRIRPVNTGTGDGYGLADWWPADQLKAADMKCWTYDVDRNMFRRNHSGGAA